MDVLRTLTIAISDDLSNIKDYFTMQGHRVVPVLEDSVHDVDAVVLSGMKKDVVGIQDIRTGVPVLEARGLSPEEIMSEVKRRTNLI